MKLNAISFMMVLKQAQSASALKAFGESSCPTPFFPLPHTTLSHFPSFRHTPTGKAHSVFSFSSRASVASLDTFTKIATEIHARERVA